MSGSTPVSLLANVLCTRIKSSHRRFSIKKAVLKNFAIFTGKHQCWSLFLVKLLKRDSNTGVFLSILRDFYEHLFWRTDAKHCFYRSKRWIDFQFSLLFFSIRLSRTFLKLCFFSFPLSCWLQNHGVLWISQLIVDDTPLTVINKWVQVFKNGPSKICGDHIPSNFLKAVFHKFYLVHSWILCPK